MPHPWPVCTPEENHTTLTRLGTGPASTLAFHAALSAEAANLAAVTGVSGATAAGTYGSWLGAGAAASTAAQTGLDTTTGALAAWVAEKLPLIATVVAGWQTAAAEMVPAEVCLANRTEEAADEQANPWVWGALTPRIAALDLDYFGHMWPRNAAAGAAYGAAAQAGAAAVLAVPPPPAVSGGSPGAPAAAAATLAQDTGLDEAGAAMRTSEKAAEQVVAQAGAAPRELGQSAAKLPLSSALGPLSALRMPGGSGSAGAPSAPSLPTGMFMPGARAMEVSAAQTSEVPPRPGVGSPPGPARGAAVGYPGAGLTSYQRPSDGFLSPAPGGRALGRPGMLNAAALRGPVTTAPAAPMPMTQLPVPPARRAGESAGTPPAVHRIVVTDQPGRDPG